MPYKIQKKRRRTMEKQIESSGNHQADWIEDNLILSSHACYYLKTPLHQTRYM